MLGRRYFVTLETEIVGAFRLVDAPNGMRVGDTIRVILDGHWRACVVLPNPAATHPSEIYARLDE